jgi:hypothetical protein
MSGSTADRSLADADGPQVRTQQKLYLKVSPPMHNCMCSTAL